MVGDGAKFIKYKRKNRLAGNPVLELLKYLICEENGIKV